MHTAVGSLLRRGVEICHAQIQKDSQYKMPTWGIVILAITSLFYFVIMSMVEYTFARVVPTLLMVESPQAILFEPVITKDPDTHLSDRKVEPELMLVKQQPITASFHTTIKHLLSKGGFRACFRGASIFVVYNFVMQWLVQFLTAFVPLMAALIIAPVIGAQLSLAWTHIVISEYSPKPWYRRVPSIKTWRKVAGPTALFAVAEQLTIFLPTWLAIYGFFGSPEQFADLSTAERQVTVIKAFSVFALSIVLALLIVVPAKVILTRVQASLLPDNEETIVPFDRSFGGKVIPEVVGGSGVIGTLDAWRTFDWNARVRLIKAYAKVMGMQVALSIMFAITILAQLFLIFGKDLKKFIPTEGQGKGNDATIY